MTGRRFLYISLLVAALTAPLSAGCGSNDLDPRGPRPNVINSVDNFAFHVATVRSQTRVYEYDWTITGAQADIDQSSAISGGRATLTIYDGSGQEVYVGDLGGKGAFVTAAGEPGEWKISITLNDATGQFTFQVKKRS